MQFYEVCGIIAFCWTLSTADIIKLTIQLIMGQSKYYTGYKGLIITASCYTIPIIIFSSLFFLGKYGVY